MIATPYTYEKGPSGLTLAPFRAYHSSLGRWISRDPIEEDGGLNLYGYVGGRPINGFDPLGLDVALNNFASWDTTRQYAEKLSLSPSKFYSENGLPFNTEPLVVVAGHGSSTAGGAKNGRILRYEVLARQIASTPEFKAGGIPVLVMCNAGSGKLAQRIADILGRPVIAPDSYVTYSNQQIAFFGNILSPTKIELTDGKDNLNPQGHWLVFRPQK
jgi:RHS repeat-associated protein